MNFSLSASSSQQNCYRKNSNIFLLLYCALRRRWTRKKLFSSKEFYELRKYFLQPSDLLRANFLEKFFPSHKFKLHKAPTILHNVQGNQESRGMKNEHPTIADTDVENSCIESSGKSIKCKRRKSLWWKKIWIYKLRSLDGSINSFWLLVYPLSVFSVVPFNNNRLWRRKNFHFKFHYVNQLQTATHASDNSPPPNVVRSKKTEKCTLIKNVLLNSWRKSDNLGMKEQ